MNVKSCNQVLQIVFVPVATLNCIFIGKFPEQLQALPILLGYIELKGVR
jgi:hypothetical protein